MNDQVHPIWTEDELDAALAGLHNDHDRGDLAGARTALYAAMNTPEPIAPRSRRRWPQWTAAAAVVTMIVAGTLVAENLGGGNGPTANAAALTLRRAATVAIGEQDPVLQPGQYRYIKENARWSTILTYNVIETWVPQDPNGNWRLRRTVVGIHQAPQYPTGDITAPCGDFYPTTANTKPSCGDIAGRAGWQEPTPAWLATLPADPQAILALLRHDGGVADPEVMVYVADALRSGLIPAHVRGVFYQTLAMLPELKVTEQVANLDGRTGVAMGIDDLRGKNRQEIIVDPTTGQFIGEREITLTAENGLKLGQVEQSTSVTTTVVDSITATS